MSKQLGLMVMTVLFMLPSPVRAQQTVEMRKWSRLIWHQQGLVPIHSSTWDAKSTTFWSRQVQYETLTGRVALIPPEPSQATLPTTVLDAFGIDISEPHRSPAYYSVSPSGQYVAYSVVDSNTVDVHEPCVLRQLRIGHIPSLTSKDIVSTELSVEYSWYGNDIGLLISDGGSCGVWDGDAVLGYVTSFSPDLSTLKSIALMRDDFINGLNLNLDVLTHVSPDGSRLLLLGDGYPSPDDRSGIHPMVVLLDVQTPANHRILFKGEQIPTNTFFKYGDASKVLAITADGLIEYDLSTEQVTVLDSTFDGSFGFNSGRRIIVVDENYYVLESTISPNGRWLLYTHEDAETGVFGFYIVDLAEALYANGATINATPTDLPTFTPVCSANGC